MMELLLVMGCLIGGAMGGGGGGGGRVSPEEQGLRGETARGGGPDLIEPPPDPLRDPRPADLNATALLTLLGPAFDHQFMAYTRPHRRDFLPPHFNYRRNKKGRLVPIGAMPKHVRDMELRYIRLADGTKLRTRVPSRLKRKLQQLLWALTACPVAYRWKDLGPRFWPRWLKEGHCPQGSCSVPPGMKCRPSASQHKTLLRWHCRSHCSWIKIKYPVVTECACSCAHQPSYS